MIATIVGRAAARYGSREAALATPPAPRSDEVGRHYNLANEVAKRRAARYLDEETAYFER